jgi:large subunit ribosomal protein L6
MTKIKITVPNTIGFFILKKQSITFVYIKGYYKIYRIILPDFVTIGIQNDKYIELLIDNAKKNLYYLLFLYQYLLKKFIMEGIAYKKKVIFLSGVGYKFYLDKTNPYLAVDAGFSDLKIIKIPQDIIIKILGRKENIIKISGLSKQLIGEFTKEIQKLKIPDSYKGKGIRVQGKKLILKKGKKPKQK